MKFDTINLGLTGYDELFLSSEEREDMKKPKVEEISILDLRPFKDRTNFCEHHRRFIPFQNRIHRLFAESQTEHRQMRNALQLSFKAIPDRRNARERHPQRADGAHQDDRRADYLFSET